MIHFRNYDLQKNKQCICRLSKRYYLNGLFEQYFSLFAVVEQRAQITTQADERFKQRDRITT